MGVGVGVGVGLGVGVGVVVGVGVIVNIGVGSGLGQPHNITATTKLILATNIVSLFISSLTLKRDVTKWKGTRYHTIFSGSSAL